MKRIFILILTIVLAFGGSAAVYAAEDTTAGNSGMNQAAGFSDVKSTNWAYPAILDMAGKNIITGYPDGTFQPNEVVTYAEFIKMAVVATGEDPGAAVSTATEKKHWAQNYYDLALKKGYFTNADISKAALNQQIPRASMALVISGILGDDVKVENYSELQESLSDVDVNTKYEYQITKAYGTGILSGYPDGTFRPYGTLTRAEAASVIQRLTDEGKRVLPERKPAGTSTSGAVTTDPAVIGNNVITYDMEGGEGSREPFPVEYVKTGPASDVISNPEFIDPSVEGLVEEGFFKNAKIYYILESAEPFRISTSRGVIDSRYIFIDGDLQSGLGLLKDGKIIRSLQPLAVDMDTGQRVFGDFVDEIPDFDYLASCGTNMEGYGADVVYLIPNPFK